MSEGPTADGSLVVRYEMTFADSRAWWVEEGPLAKSAMAKRPSRLTMLLSSVLLAGGAGLFAVGIASASEGGIGRYPLPFWGAAGVAWLLAIEVQRRTMRKSGGDSPLASCMPRRLFREVCGPTTVRADRSGIATQIGEGETRADWASVRWIESVRAGVRVHLVGGRSLLIPSRAFASGAEMEAAAETLRGWHDASGFGEVSRLRALVAEGVPRCPSCRYDLAGLSSRVCPECGRAFTVPEMEALAEEHLMNVERGERSGNRGVSAAGRGKGGR